MERRNKFLKVFALLAFLAFTLVSCWATSESLCLTLENAQIPTWIFWIAVLGLFVLSSYCAKLFIDSLLTNEYVERRKLKFYVGLLGVVVLWMLFSMPTNTHTFFYKQMSQRTAERELTFLDGQLQQVTDTMAFLTMYESKWNNFELNVNTALDLLKQEINDPQKLGFGPLAEKRLSDIENLFGLATGTVERRATSTGTIQERNAVCKYYDNVVKNRLNQEKDKHNAHVQALLANFKGHCKGVETIRKDIKKELDDLKNPNLEKEAVLRQARQVINRSYAILESSFDRLYESDNDFYKSDRLTKVTKVWGDYLTGRFNNTDYTLWYWILLSVIVDVAAFAFFAIAFKKDEYDF